MKLLFTCLLGSSLLVFTACKQQDQKLITKVEAEIQKRQADLPRYEAVGLSLEKFRAELEATFPSRDDAPVDSLKLTANAMVTKEKAALEAYREGITNLTNRLAEYRAGTAKKEALDLEYVVTSESLGNMQKTFGILENQDIRLREEFNQRVKKQAGK